jgi:hypothetical protein
MHATYVEEDPDEQSNGLKNCEIYRADEPTDPVKGTPERVKALLVLALQFKNGFNVARGICLLAVRHG